MTIYLFMSEIDNSAKLTWLLLIVALPILGATLLLYTQINLGHRVLQQRAEEQINKTKDLIAQPAGVAEKLETEGRCVDDLSRYLCRSGCFPVYENTEVTYFPIGEDKFRAMLEEIAKAEHFIFMEYFIIEEGYMWGKILEILIRKAKEGVDVRVMYDGMCEMSTLPADYWKLLEKEGIRSKAFAPIIPVLSSHYNYRDHRKILVIDGHTAFTGGINLSDRYININSPFGYWKDTGIRLVGDAVYNYTEMFLEMWTSVRPEEAPSVDLKEYMPHRWHPEPFTGQGFVQPYGDDPLDDNPLAENIYIDMLGQVKDYVYIFTPYLILSDELRNSLIMAAKRGVDVKIVTPGIPDKKTVYQVTRSNYSALLQVGIEIYEFTPGFIHAKSMVCDDKMAIVGTINWDFRSLFLHFECASWFYGCKAVLDVKRDVFETIGKSRKIEPGEFRPGWWGGCVNSVLRVFSPLL